MLLLNEKKYEISRGNIIHCIYEGKKIVYRVGTSSTVFHAEFDVALVVDTRCVRKLVSLEIYLGLGIVIAVVELAHDFSIDWATDC